MKKFLKVLLILVLVAVAVGTTIFIFYSNQKKQKDCYVSASNFVSSNDRIETDSIASWLNEEVDSRFGIIDTTLDRLYKFATMQEGYLLAIKNNKKVNEDDIIEKFNKASKTQSIILRMAEEYELKLDNNTFDKQVRANELYKAYTDYIRVYAGAVNEVNSQIKKCLKNNNIDIKFCITELYCNVVISSFKEYNNSNLIEIKNKENVQFLNEYVDINNGYLILEEPFTINNNYFVNYYSKCKSDFASNVKENVLNIGGYSEDFSDLEKTAYYFKLIWGV